MLLPGNNELERNASAATEFLVRRFSLIHEYLYLTARHLQRLTKSTNGIRSVLHSQNLESGGGGGGRRYWSGFQVYLEGGGVYS